MFKIFFFATGLLAATAAIHGNDDLMEIKMGIQEVNKLLYPKNGKAPLPRHLNSAELMLEETMDLLKVYTTVHPFAAENKALGKALDKAASELLYAKLDMRDDKKVFLG